MKPWCIRAPTSVIGRIISKHCCRKSSLIWLESLPGTSIVSKRCSYTLHHRCPNASHAMMRSNNVIVPFSPNLPEARRCSGHCKPSCAKQQKPRREPTRYGHSHTRALTRVCVCACVVHVRVLYVSKYPHACLRAGDKGVEGAAQQVERGNAKRAIGASAHERLASKDADGS